MNVENEESIAGDLTEWQKVQLLNSRRQECEKAMITALSQAADNMNGSERHEMVRTGRGWLSLNNFSKWASAVPKQTAVAAGTRLAVVDEVLSSMTSQIKDDSGELLLAVRERLTKWRNTYKSVWAEPEYDENFNWDPREAADKVKRDLSAYQYTVAQALTSETKMHQSTTCNPPGNLPPREESLVEALWKLQGATLSNDWLSRAARLDLQHIDSVAKIDELLDDHRGRLATSEEAAAKVLTRLEHLRRALANAEGDTGRETEDLSDMCDSVRRLWESLADGNDWNLNTHEDSVRLQALWQLGPVLRIALPGWLDRKEGSIAKMTASMATWVLNNGSQAFRDLPRYRLPASLKPDILSWVQVADERQERLSSKWSTTRDLELCKERDTTLSRWKSLAKHTTQLLSAKIKKAELSSAGTRPGSWSLEDKSSLLPTLKGSCAEQEIGILSDLFQILGQAGRTPVSPEVSGAMTRACQTLSDGLGDLTAENPITPSDEWRQISNDLLCLQRCCEETPLPSVTKARTGVWAWW